MAKTEEADKPEKKKKSERRLFLIVFALLVALGTAYYISLGPLETEENTQTEVAETQVADIESAYEGGETVSETLPFDLSEAKRERLLGDPSAPIKITEHASLTCSHCAHFHKDSFAALKKAYIDTGRAYLVFSDFPLNAPALSASMISRCVPEDRYFDFIGTLFEDQGEWAYEPGYQDILKEKAEQFGLDSQTAEACLQSESLQTAVLERMKAVQQQWEISSTPSFIINNQVVISGAMPFEEFHKKIQEAVKTIDESQSGGE